MGLEIYNSMAMHEAMLTDAVRNRAFLAGLRHAVRRDSVVLDVGAGTGVLSLFAAAAGARKVYAVERSAVAAHARAAVGHLGSRVEVIQADIADVVLPERVDVIVSEWLGAFGIDENLVGMVLQARDRWLKPGGRLLPEKVSALAAPLEQGHAAMVAVPGTGPGSRVPLRWSWAGTPAQALLSDPQPMWATDLAAMPARDAQLPFRTRLRFRAARPGMLEGFVTWFCAAFGGGIALANAPGGQPTHWGQLIFPLARPTPVSIAAEIRFELTSMPAAPGYCHHAWSIGVGSHSEHHDTRGRATIVSV